MMLSVYYLFLSTTGTVEFGALSHRIGSLSGYLFLISSVSASRFSSCELDLSIGIRLTEIVGRFVRSRGHLYFFIIIRKHSNLNICF